jgi:hypothetical protein
VPLDVREASRQANDEINRRQSDWKRGGNVLRQPPDVLGEPSTGLDVIGHVRVLDKMPPHLNWKSAGVHSTADQTLVRPEPSGGSTATVPPRSFDALERGRYLPF